MAYECPKRHRRRERRRPVAQVPKGEGRSGRTPHRESALQRKGGFAVLILGSFLLCPTCAPSAEVSSLRGRLANPGFEGRRIRATLFFPGQARDGTNPYHCEKTPPENLTLYTVHPADDRNLKWSESTADRNYVLDRMTQAGINVVCMSSWGEDFLPCLESWALWAPMQTSTKSHDELFDALEGKPLLVIPFIESRGNWNFRNEFPRWTDGRTAPGTVSQIVNLVNRYIKNTAHREWAARWARVYDGRGQARYAVSLIHASSNRLAADAHAEYAAGFDLAADSVYAATGVRVGFFIDALPPDSFAPGTFKPSPEKTGPFLARARSILGIQCFIPEIWARGVANENERILWKRSFSQRWHASGVPFLMDISPGYDAHLVFPGSVTYGYTEAWLGALESMVEDFGENGVVYNSWNGFTEGMAAVLLRKEEGGARYFRWLRNLITRPFKRGDSNSDGTVDIGDAVCVLSFLFDVDSGRCRDLIPDCLDAADANDDGEIDIADAITVLGYLFAGGPAPPNPGPHACGFDPTGKRRKDGCCGT